MIFISLSFIQEYLHARNIVHRDVKPENCLLERYPNGKLQIKLADFGLAMEVTKPIYQVCGTPTYVAPEILVEGGKSLIVRLINLFLFIHVRPIGETP